MFVAESPPWTTVKVQQEPMIWFYRLTIISSNNDSRNCNNNENDEEIEDQQPLKIDIPEIVEALIK